MLSFTNHRRIVVAHVPITLQRGRGNVGYHSAVEVRVRGTHDLQHLFQPYVVLRLRLLQSSLIGSFSRALFVPELQLTRRLGVVLLHLLLIPGTAFSVNGTQKYEQVLHPQHTAVNPSLLMIG